MTVRYESRDRVAIVTIDRPEVRNAVDGETAAELASAFRAFEKDPGLDVAVLTGAGGTFCAGADLKALAAGRPMSLTEDGDGPMGPTRMLLSKPVIAAIEGYAVAGGLELALWCDLRVAASDSTFGVFCRRLGVPLIDLGTIRLPRLIGHSRAMDLLLTGRAVPGPEAFEIGLANRLAEPGGALEAAVQLATEIAAVPQTCMRNDRRSAYEQWDTDLETAVVNEFKLGIETIASGETQGGAERFSAGEGRSGASLSD